MMPQSHRLHGQPTSAPLRQPTSVPVPRMVPRRRGVAPSGRPPLATSRTVTHETTPPRSASSTTTNAAALSRARKANRTARQLVLEAAPLVTAAPNKTHAAVAPVPTPRMPTPVYQRRYHGHTSAEPLANHVGAGGCARVCRRTHVLATSVEAPSEAPSVAPSPHAAPSRPVRHVSWAALPPRYRTRPSMTTGLVGRRCLVLCVIWWAACLLGASCYSFAPVLGLCTREEPLRHAFTWAWTKGALRWHRGRGRSLMRFKRRWLDPQPPLASELRQLWPDNRPRVRAGTGRD